MNDNHSSFTVTAEIRRTARTFFHQSFTEIYANKDHGYSAFFKYSLRILRKARKRNIMRLVKRGRILKTILVLRKIKKLNRFSMVFSSSARGRLSALRFSAQLNCRVSSPFFSLLHLSVAQTCSSLLSLRRSVRSN